MIQFQGNALTLWSLSPIQRGWIDDGDELILVHQRMPFSKNTRFALAFWNGRPNPVRGIAATSHTFSIILAIVCIAGFSAETGPFNNLWIVVCILAAAISAIYLLLMWRAMGALRSFIKDSDAL